MKPSTLTTLLGLLTLVTSACKAEAPAAPPAGTPASAPAQEATPSPTALLAAMDPRAPVPLQPMMAWHQKQNMMAHLVAIQQITAALGRGDFAAAARASKDIEASPQMKAMCEHMGAGAEGFTPLALEFHERASAIGEAARQENLQAALQATAHTIEACTTCHSKYRQDVVDEATWQARTGSQHMPGSMPHGQR